MSEKTYKIRRFFAPHRVESAYDVEGMAGLTLEEAQEYCSRKDTREAGEWFDGYTNEN